jgi:hypothetical protein
MPENCLVQLNSTCRIPNRTRSSFLIFPFYQPFVWLSAPAGAFKPDTAGIYLITTDTLIGLLALEGLPRLYRRQPFYFIWLITGMAMLLLWQTKWQQFTMIIMVPLCLSAATGTGWLYDLLKKGLVSWRNRVPNASHDTAG